MTQSRAARRFDYPLHRLNEPGSLAWLRGGPVTQRAMAAALLKNYPRGLGIVICQPMYLTHVVSARGEVRELARPWKLIEFWEIANGAPPADCWCKDFVDHESGVRWADRFSQSVPISHHPLCQYDPAALAAYARIVRTYKNKPHERPDGWIKTNAQVKSELGLIT